MDLKVSQGCLSGLRGRSAVSSLFLLYSSVNSMDFTYQNEPGYFAHKLFQNHQGLQYQGTCYFLCPLGLSLGLFWASSFLQNQNGGASGCPLGCWPPGRWAPPLEEGSDNWVLWHRVAHFSSPCIWWSTGPCTAQQNYKKLEVQPCHESREQRVIDNHDHWCHPCCPHMPGRLPVRSRFTIDPRWPGHSH